MPRTEDDDRPAPRRILLATPGFEGALLAELASTPAVAAADRPDAAAPYVATVTAPGIVCAAEVPAAGAFAVLPGFLDPVFARQQLPAAVEVRGGSVAMLAESAYLLVEGAVDQATGPFSLHAFPPTGADPGLGSRAALIGRELLARLRERRRRSARRYLPADEAATAFGELGLLIQILLVAPDRAWVSSTSPRPLPMGGWTVAPWPSGVAPVLEDRKPPSRAYRKLEEAFLWMGDAPAAGESCVDLGAAPGGWTYAALRRGARVVAIDRAPLEPPVRGHSRLTMIEGNAFTYEPPAAESPVDWLLSDVICEPQRALAQLERWLERGWCSKLVMTIKFKGQESYGMLADVREVLERAGWENRRIKHLHHNKNEVTVMAARAFPQATSRKVAPPR